MTIVYPVKRGLYVNLTNRCPCACTFCIRQNGSGVYGSGSLWLEREPTARETEAALVAAGPTRYAEIVFCGYGEPTERLDVLLEVARFVRLRWPDIRIRVNTNGLSDLIAGAPTAMRFAGLVDVLSVSLNAESSEAYERICRPRFGGGAYEAMLRFASEAKRHVPEVVFTVVATPDFTASRRQACEEVASRLGIPLSVREYTPPARGG